MSGCRKTFLQAEVMDDHQKNCIFRMISCPSKHMGDGFGCMQKVLFKDIVDHLTACQMKEGAIVIEKNKKCTIYLQTMLNKGDDEDRIIAWYPSEFYLDDTQMTFYLVGHVDSKSEDFIHWWIYFLGSPQEVKNYDYTLSIGKTGDKLTYNGHVKPLDEEWNDIIAEQSGCVIGTKIIDRLSDENNELPIEVTIHALKEEAKDSDVESGVSTDESE